MKKTKYFTSTQKSGSQVSAAIDEATSKRDAWLESMEGKIGKIDSEIFHDVVYNNTNYVVVVIQLNYYLS